jgi:hypothetical protein
MVRDGTQTIRIMSDHERAEAIFHLSLVIFDLSSSEPNGERRWQMTNAKWKMEH